MIKKQKTQCSRYIPTWFQWIPPSRALKTNGKIVYFEHLYAKLKSYLFFPKTTAENSKKKPKLQIKSRDSCLKTVLINSAYLETWKFTQKLLILSNYTHDYKVI